MSANINSSTFGALLLASSLFGASGVSAEGPKIGLLLPLTGAYLQVGAECRSGYEAEENLQKRSTTVYGDSQADPKVSTTEFKRLAEVEHVDAVATVRSPVGLAINPLSKQYKIPVLGLVANPKFVEENPYAMQFWPPPAQEGALMANEATLHGLKKAAVFVMEDDWMIPLSEGFRRQFQANGGEISFFERFPPSEIDALPSLLTRAKQQSPQLLTFLTSIQQIPVLIRRARELGMKQRVYTLWWAQNPEIMSAAMPENMHDVSYTETDFSYPEFLNAYSAKFKTPPPTAATFLCYLIARAFDQALDAGPQGFRENLLKLPAVKISAREFPIQDRIIQVPIHLREVQVPAQ